MNSSIRETATKNAPFQIRLKQSTQNTHLCVNSHAFHSLLLSNNGNFTFFFGIYVKADSLATTTTHFNATKITLKFRHPSNSTTFQPKRLKHKKRREKRTIKNKETASSIS